MKNQQELAAFLKGLEKLADETSRNVEAQAQQTIVAINQVLSEQSPLELLTQYKEAQTLTQTPIQMTKPAETAHDPMLNGLHAGDKDLEDHLGVTFSRSPQDF